MAENKGKRRLEAIGQQLGNPEGLPAIRQVAAPSTSPRVKDKVIIITGE